jgi:cation transport regulator ChaB
MTAPATTRRTETDMPGRDELPAPLKRSSVGAQRLWIGAHDGAVKQYGEGERAHRTAFAALKRAYERVDDRWVKKKTPGPSDPRSKGTTAQKRAGVGETYGGVDAEGHTRDELMARARRLEIRGRSGMTKAELARAIAAAQT